MTRQFGPWRAKIIGPMAHLHGPRNLSIIGGADRLRGMSTGDTDFRAALVWALGELE